ncbi:MAG: alpha-2-macroglobulin [Prevotella sp.]|nr:alpha-2-macroglobulin [Prevotella sp.]
MKRYAAILLLLSLAIASVRAQVSFATLWKQEQSAEQRGLPRTQYDVLRQIVQKAEREKAYGQLMKAEVKSARVMAEIAPDSLQPALSRIGLREKQAKDDIQRTIYRLIVNRICRDNPSVERPGGMDSIRLTPDLCKKLASVKATDFEPLVKKGVDSRVFNDDLLSVVGYETGDYQALHDYYQQTGNRPATLLTALEMLRQHRPEGRVAYKDAPYLARIDSLIALYGDLPEAGEAAIERHFYMNYTDATPGDFYDYAAEAIKRWGGYKRTDELRNALTALTTRQFHATVRRNVSLPQREQSLTLNDLRNIDELTLHIYQVRATGEMELNPDNTKDYERLKPLLTPLSNKTVRHAYKGKKPYELFSDTIPIPALPNGVYLLEMTSKPTTQTVRRLYYVSNIAVMWEPLPKQQTRYVVVDATTGQPLKGATVKFTPTDRNKKDKVVTLATDNNGECRHQFDTRTFHRIYASTPTDKNLPLINNYGAFSFSPGTDRIERTHIYTDRAVYRPGQTVHAAAIVYEATKPDGYDANNASYDDKNTGYNDKNANYKTISGKRLTFSLRDANHQQIGEQTATTDKYGVCSVDFQLPAHALPGTFSILLNGMTQTFRVEEYKRPTFEVTFDGVTQDYSNGDTVTTTATALTYAGIPVQGEKVRYSVMRRPALWWRIGTQLYDEEVAAGETVTDDKGRFEIKIPMHLPEALPPVFCNFIVTADVTDQAGETHFGQLSLPLGNRKAALSCDMPNQVRADKMKPLIFHLRNAAGNDMDAEVCYRIDNSKWQTTQTRHEITLPRMESGSHRLTAVCKGDTLTQEFTVFSLDDRRPAIKTDDWYYLSAEQFPNDGTPVTLQVGSSAENVHIVYSLICGDRLIESGFADKSNELINRKLTYKAEYGDGLLLTFAWVKEGVYHHHKAFIRRPQPDKRLTLQWQTFRDRLTPGQQEEWTLTVAHPDGTPADASLMATLYDKSLDQLRAHDWRFDLYQFSSRPFSNWMVPSHSTLWLYANAYMKYLEVKPLDFSHLDGSIFPQFYRMHIVNAMAAGGTRRMAKASMKMEAMADEAIAGEMETAVMTSAQADDSAEESIEEGGQATEVQVRENLNETAFFYPQLTTDAEGRIALKFTLPESLTTWRFLSIAHTPDMAHGTLSAEAVARKEVMIQPNMPRFVRMGDAATISARIFNTGEKDRAGKVVLRLIAPETDAIVYETTQALALPADSTMAVTFQIPSAIFQTSSAAPQASSATPGDFHSLLICRVTVSGDDFSDGEQHYLPILPNMERVTITLPFTQMQEGAKEIDLSTLIPADASNRKLTLEYTDNPAWLMIQALPAIGTPSDDNAVSLAASYYTNSIGRHIVSQNPKIKTIFNLWKQETGNETSLTSALAKNQELKDILLSETPWLMDADRETEQKQRLADFFDENTMQNRLTTTIGKLRSLQLPDGAFSWWQGMQGSFYMTATISEMLVRLNAMTSQQEATQEMLTQAIGYMGKEIAEDVKKMKEAEKKGHKPTFPGNKALQWLYICALDGRKLPASVQQANDWLIGLLKKSPKQQSIYEKAMTAIILSSGDAAQSEKGNARLAKEHAQSIKEYTVYKASQGRYYDTPRTGYSWCDYRIPTQTAAIEALQRVTPEDTQTINEMRQWLLQEKRTQAWDTPINSVNAIYAFLNKHREALQTNQQPTTFSIDGKPLEMPKATSGLGYVKTEMPADAQRLTIRRGTGATAVDSEAISDANERMSWGAIYAQFFQQTKKIKDNGSEISIKREVLKDKAQTTDNKAQTAINKAQLKVGDRIRIRITIKADRDLDFVQIIDRRAACMEPANPISGYRNGAYIAPKDNATNYYFDRLPKGKHVIETEYYIDRAGTYETGTCTVQCAYAPEFRATTQSQTIETKQ